MKNNPNVRQRLIAALEKMRTYYDHHGGFAVHYNVKLGLIDASAERVFRAAYPPSLHMSPPPPAELPREVRDMWDDDREFERALRTARENLCEGETYVYRTYGPITAQQHGLPYFPFGRPIAQRVYKPEVTPVAGYPAGKPGWYLSRPYNPKVYEAEFTLRGRSAGHLCVTRFEGVDLDGDLIDRILDADGGCSNEWCRDLLAMLGEWEVLFSRETATQEVMYHLSDSMQQLITEHQDKVAAQAKEAEEVTYWASRDIVTKETP